MLGLAGSVANSCGSAMWTIWGFVKLFFPLHTTTLSQSGKLIRAELRLHLSYLPPAGLLSVELNYRKHPDFPHTFSRGIRRLFVGYQRFSHVEQLWNFVDLLTRARGQKCWFSLIAMKLNLRAFWSSSEPHSNDFPPVDFLSSIKYLRSTIWAPLKHLSGGPSLNQTWLITEKHFQEEEDIKPAQFIIKRFFFCPIYAFKLINWIRAQQRCLPHTHTQQIQPLKLVIPYQSYPLPNNTPSL